MRLNFGISLVLLLCALMVGCQKQQNSTQDSQVKQSAQFVAALTKGEYASAVGQFDAKMKATMPEGKLKEVWQQLEGQLGKFKNQSGTRVEQVAQNGVQYKVVFVTCQFERANVDVKTVYNAQGEISGLWFVPSGQ